MYNIWLIINTFYELALANLGLVASVTVAWLALMVVAGLKKSRNWSAAVKPALVVAVAAWVVCFVLVPGLTKSSFANVTYSIDYLVVAGVALAMAGMIALFFAPLYLLARR